MEKNDQLPRLAFVHIPKTAGTSVTSALSAVYSQQMFHGMTTLDYALYSPEQLTEYRFFKGHAYRRDYEKLPVDTTFFSVMRDPVDRAISYYNYYRTLDANIEQDPFVREAISLSQNQGVIEFIYSDSPFVIEHLRLGQVRQFVTGETLAEMGHRQFLSRRLQQKIFEEFVEEVNRFQYFMTTELLELHFYKMLHELQIPHAADVLAHENRSESDDLVNTFDVRRALIDVGGLEFTCYDYVRKREAESLVHWGRRFFKN